MRVPVDLQRGRWLSPRERASGEGPKNGRAFELGQLSHVPLKGTGNMTLGEGSAPNLCTLRNEVLPKKGGYCLTPAERNQHMHQYSMACI